MYAFRMAHEKRDAKAKLDLRDEAGERVIANTSPSWSTVRPKNGVKGR